MADWGHATTARLVHWTADASIVVLRLSLGVVFLWFGLLKFFPTVSAAEALATRTLHTLTWGALTPPLALPLLALWETVIGLGLLLGVWPTLTLALLFLHLGGTLTPLLLFPHEMFAHIPYAPTLEAQYILKNLVFLSAGCVIGTARLGRQQERTSRALALLPQTREGQHRASAHQEGDHERYRGRAHARGS